MSAYSPLQKRCQSAKMASATTVRPNASIFFPLEEAENTSLQDLASPASLDGATMPACPELYATEVAVTSTNVSERDTDNALRSSALTPSSPLPTMSPHVYFPAELWSTTLRHLREGTTLEDLEDLSYLWLSVRQVSRLFRKEIEKFFMEEYIARTELLAIYDFTPENEDSCWSLYGPREDFGPPTPTHADCYFSHFEQDSEEASISNGNVVFRFAEGPWLDRQYEKLGYRGSLRCTFNLFAADHPSQLYPNRASEFVVTMPRRDERTFVYQKEAGINANGLPAVTFDIEERSFSFEWRVLFAYIFRQHLIYATWDTGTLTSLKCSEEQVVIPQSPGSTCVEHSDNEPEPEHWVHHSERFF